MVNLRAILGLLGLGLMVSVAIWVLAARAQRHGLTPEDANLQAAADAISKDVRVGDAIAFRPGWSAAQQWRFASVWRKKGLDFDASLALGDPIEPWDVDGSARLWVVSTHGLADTLRLPAQARRVQARDFGHGTSVDLFELPPSRTVLDLRKHLNQAQVSREDEPGVFKPCTWNGDKFDCGADWWRSIWEFDNEVGSGRRRCIFFQPTRDGGITRLVWPAPPRALEIAGHFGLRMWGVRVDEGSDLVMRVFAGDRQVYEKAVPRGDFTWYSWRVPLTAVDRGKDVRFEFTAAKVSWRQGCFDARLQGAPKDGL